MSPSVEPAGRSNDAPPGARAVFWLPSPVASVLVASFLLMAPPVTSAGEPASIAQSKFELFVTSVEESTRFYTALGFEVAHAKPDGYTTLHSGSTVIALSPVPSWLPLRWVSFLRYPPIGTEIVLYTSDLEGARGSLEAAGYAPGAITLQSWGDRDFRLTDYEGYYVRVTEGTAVPVSP